MKAFIEEISRSCSRLERYRKNRKTKSKAAIDGWLDKATAGLSSRCRPE